jgi:type IX secretion system PorP/SprF family membrane protein
MRLDQRIYIFLIGVVFYIMPALQMQSQSIHFSQAYSAHLTLNPANTGRFIGDWRAAGIYRHQGHQLSDDYRTSFFSFEHPFYYKEEKIDVGLYYSRDNSAGNTLPVDRLNVSAGNAIRLGHRSTLSAGIQAAWVYKQVDWNRITFPDQYSRDIGGFDPQMPTGDVMENSATSYVDLGFGLLYSMGLENGVWNAGYSMQQVNRPDESFFDTRYELPLKHIWHLKGDFDLGSQFFVIPAVVLLRTGSASSLLSGVNIGYKLDEWMGQHNSFLAGLHLRNATFNNSESLIISCGATWQFWTFLISFDTDISGAKTKQLSSSALEFGLVFKLPSTEITRKVIPCERY